MWRPDTVPVPITGDVALGLHLQLFEVFLTALTIGFAVFGFVGYSTIREAAERRAEDTAKEVVQSLMVVERAPETASTPIEPDLSGLDQDVEPGDREEEEGL